MTDCDGQLKMGLFLRRCMESKKKKAAAAASDGAGAEPDGAAEATYDLGDFEVGGASVIARRLHCTPPAPRCDLA